ncbi:family 1 glycosylhydrolase [Microbacteriaceae bacterium VKM Ac-2855]|nr:family 1 glycosylhydrolase [Microbacteriaceae bacterium VKM Ac-2855]
MSGSDSVRGRSRRESAAEAARFDDPRELGGLLPSGLRIGVATSAFQTEGSLETDGRGTTVWDEFAGRRHTIALGATPEVATDFYRRFADDIALLLDLGVRDLRLSAAWTRLQPAGRGAFSRAGFAFYDRLLDALAEAGIRPMLTLHHRDTPSSLPGGWMNRDTAFRFGDYAFEIASRLGDRVDAWVTLDQPTTVALEGYALTSAAPGYGRLFNALPALHHQLLGHGVAVEALRAAAVPGRIGIVDAYAPVEPASDREADRTWAEVFGTLHNRIVPDALLTGAYPSGPEELAVLFDALTTVDPGDLVRINAPLDFYGVAPLPPVRIVAGRDPDAPTGVGAPPVWPFHTALWPEFPVDGAGAPNAPSFVGVALRELRDRYGESLPAVVIGALGVAYPDAQDESGAIVDTERIRWLGSHLAALVEAVAPGGDADGVTLEAVYLWTLVDAFEWQAGYTRPHGLVALDADGYGRVPKASFDWLRRALDARS